MKDYIVGKLVSFFLVLAGIFIPSFSVDAAPGALDLTFNNTGTARTGFGGGNAQGYAMAVQSDGKLILGGVANKDYPAVGGAFVLARFDTSNVLDVSFGNNGAVITPVGMAMDTFWSAAVNAIKVQDDGKIVAGGFANIGTTYPDPTIIRYHPDGSLDSSFGTNGIIYKDFGQGAKITAMSIQSDGKIVVGGYLAATPGSSGGAGIILARYQTNGILDTNFGLNGITTAFAGQNFALYAMLPTINGNIFAVGSGTKAGDPGLDFALYRFTSNGVPDITFGGGTGAVLTRPTASSSYIDEAKAIAYQLGNHTVQNPDRLVVVGYHWNFTGSDDVSQTIVRYFLDGSLDTSFGTAGVTTNVVGAPGGFGDYAVGVAIQGIDIQPRKIIVGGYASTSGANFFTVARYTSAGAFDTTFNGTGKLLIPAGPGAYDIAAAAGVQGGQFVVAGTRTISSYASVLMAARVTSTGALDTNFGGAGIITADVSDADAQAKAVAVQPDGKIIAAGYANNGGQSVMALARYQTNGLLDPQFGAAGRVLTRVGSNDVASAVVVQPDGKILAAGGSFGLFALARYGTNGVLDSSFGTNGIVTTSFGGSAEALSLQYLPDGKIVVGGDVNQGGSFIAFALARYTTNGTLDSTFGSGGKVTTSFSSPSLSEATGLQLQPDGKVVAGGFTIFTSGTTQGADFALARYSTNGSLDFSFGSLGRVATNFLGTSDLGNSTVLQPDGKILVAGNALLGANSYIAIARFNTNGSLDASFGSAGSVISQVGADSDTASAMTLQPDGKIVIAGASRNGIYRSFAQRFNTDGSPDNSFGSGGAALLNFGSGTNEFAYAVALDSEGRTIVAGDAGGYFGVARLGANPQLAVRFAPAQTVIVSWPWPSTGWHLEQKNNLPGTGWITPAETVSHDGTNNFIMVNPPAGSRFYRLRFP